MRNHTLSRKLVSERRAESAKAPLYEPLDFVLARAPLLPVEIYLALADGTSADRSNSNAAAALALQHGSLAPADPRIRRALAVGSLSLLDALERASPSSPDAAHLRGKLLRFLIRMSTRPTPYGLFAGVALAHWGPHTDLALAASPPCTRTRPDMLWLLHLVRGLEAEPRIRSHLRLVANPLGVILADRVILKERAPSGRTNTGPAVSLRATGVVKRALALAREPIAYPVLVARLLTLTPDATEEKVEALLTELWSQTLLLTDLWPPLTATNPAQYVLGRLAEIPEVGDIGANLQLVRNAASSWDTLPAEAATDAYRKLVDKANALTAAPSDPPVQVDTALTLSGRSIAQAVATEVARAAELLLRLSPLPSGLPYLTAYRQAFVSRYGLHRRVPLLELLDTNVGLGSPFLLGNSSPPLPPAKAVLRAQTLLDIAYQALHDHRRVVLLDADTLARLETWTPTPATAPTSLDINVFLSAASASALDAGEFEVIIGPNLGAQAAGRHLGRFSDLLGPEAMAALDRAARAEEAHAPDRLWAELVYLPDRFRSANVAIRPAVRRYEIPLGVSAGVPPSQVIPLGELVVGVRNGRFSVYWPAVGKEVVACTGHMLNYLQAPLTYRFLAELSRDGVAQFTSFDWGPAANFPFLPRVQVGRIVLRPAEWRIDTLRRDAELTLEPPEHFAKALERWREHWHVPRHVYLTMGDNRLLLDLQDSQQVEELRTEVRSLQGSGHLVLQEVLPALDRIWTEGPDGHFVTEFVASLMLQNPPGVTERSGQAPASALPPSPAVPNTSNPAECTCSRVRPPGSEWLFVKLYCGRDFEEDLIAGRLRTFAEKALSSGMAESWFFVRYSDPDRHIRLRFRGDPPCLTGRLLPALCTWGAELMHAGLCLRFTFDTFERELERFGGPAGTEIAEAIFAADSRAVAELLHLVQRGRLPWDRTTLAILSVDDLLRGLGLSQPDRLQWYKDQVIDRHEAGPEYRQRKALLRSLLAEPDRLGSEPGGAAVAHVLATRRAALGPAAERLQALRESGKLDQLTAMLYGSYVHLHCNRLLAADWTMERRVLGLLLRTWEGLIRAPEVRPRHGAKELSHAGQA